MITTLIWLSIFLASKKIQMENRILPFYFGLVFVLGVQQSVSAKSAKGYG